MKATSSIDFRNPRNDRRIEPRVPSNGIGHLTVLKTPQTRELDVRIIDVSRSGIQVELDEPLEPATTVEIRLRDVIVMGLVGNCRPHEHGRYRLGVITGSMLELSHG